MATKSITIHINDDAVDVLLKSARKEDGIRRAELMLRFVSTDPADLTNQVGWYQYPTCVSAVKEPDWVRDMTFGDFLSTVDEADIEVWLTEAYTLNPQWKAGMQALAGIAEKLTEEQEKKSGTSASGSLTPTETSKKMGTSHRLKHGGSKTSQMTSSRKPSSSLPS